MRAKLSGVLRDTPVVAQTSYGVQKAIVEMYVYDYGRKGYLDTRSVRLPSVTVRPGAVSVFWSVFSRMSWLTSSQPSSAASSFMSGLVREPLQGQESILPIASSIDDPVLTSMPCYLTRTKVLVRNVAFALCMDEKEFSKQVGLGRSINLPGFKATPKQMIDAL